MSAVAIETAEHVNTLDANNPKDFRAIVLGMAETIEKRGLAFGDLQNSQGEVCVMGAMNIVVLGKARPNEYGGYGTNFMLYDTKLCHELTKLICPERLRMGVVTLFGPGQHLAGWSNSSSGTTVVSKLREVAEQL